MIRTTPFGYWWACRSSPYEGRRMRGLGKPPGTDFGERSPTVEFSTKPQVRAICAPRQDSNLRTQLRRPVPHIGL